MECGFAGGLVAGEAPGHDDEHRPLGHRRVVLRESFVVADGAPAAVDPGKCAFAGPPAVQDDEADLVGEFTDGLQGDAPCGAPVDEFALVAGVGPDQGDAGETLPDGPDQRAGTVTVLDVGAGNQDRKQLTRLLVCDAEDDSAVMQDVVVQLVAQVDLPTRIVWPMTSIADPSQCNQ